MFGLRWGWGGGMVSAGPDALQPPPPRPPAPCPFTCHLPPLLVPDGGHLHPGPPGWRKGYTTTALPWTLCFPPRRTVPSCSQLPIVPYLGGRDSDSRPHVGPSVLVPLPLSS